MQMAEQFDISTLAWVKGEIDETLKQARIALETYVEDTTQSDALKKCVDYIHQVYGTLQVVELMGAALFAEETETFAKGLLNAEVNHPEAGHELLMRAILQLPDYLESLLNGEGDNPVALLPLLNEMRELRGEQLLDSAEFFRPDLTINPPRHGEEHAPTVTAQEAAAKLHRFYLSHFAKLIKDKKSKESLAMLGNIVSRLFASASTDNWRRILWIATAFIEGLDDQSIAVNRDSKLLLGKLEQQIKTVANTGEDAELSTAATAMLNKMLYLLASSGAIGKQAAAVRLAFNLDRYMPGGQVGLGGLNAELKQTVSADIMEDLSRIKDVFDIFVRSDRGVMDSLAPMAESLGRMADTLSLLQEESLREILQEQIAVIEQMLAGKVAASDDVLMGIAGAILAVESALSDWGSNAPVVRADADDEQVVNSESTPQAEAEHQRVTRQVMREAKEDLIRVREAISHYLGKPDDAAVLEPLPGLLHMIIGSLNLLSYKRVAQVLTSCRGFIEQALIPPGELPESSKLDALADAIMSVEYYLEAFIHSRVHPSSVLDVAEEAVATLGYPIGMLQEPVDAQQSEEVPELDGIELIESADEEALDSDLDVLSLEATTAPVIADGELNESDLALLPDETLVESDATLVPELGEAVPETATKTTAAASSPAAPISVEVDDEIIEIFIEEAEEELGSIRELLPKWVADQSDTESLQTLRRSFHTLKGSGRLVGASELGEFAWAFESMLNRVIDGSLQTGTVVFDLLEQARDVLPQLIDAFRTGGAAVEEAETLRQMAVELVDPNAAKATSHPAEARATEPAEAPASETEMAPSLGDQAGTEAEAADTSLTEDRDAIPALDPVLLDIYTKESEGHLGQIDDYIAKFIAGGSHKIGEPLIRALHTLKGSSRMASVMPVAELCSVLEKYTKTLQANHQTINETGIEALSACRNYVQAMLGFLANREAPQPDSGPAQALADAVFAEIQHLEDIANAMPEVGLASSPEADAAPVESEALIASSGDELTDEQRIEAIRLDEEESKAEWEFELLEEPAAAAELDSAPESSSAAPADSWRLSDGDYDEELLDIFLDEGAEILDASEETLQAWVDNPSDRSLVEALQRQLHTLKGGARMAGITPVGDLSHSLETALEAMSDGLLERSPQMLDLLQLSHDRLVIMLDQVRNHTSLSSGDDLIERVMALAGKGDDGLGADAAQPAQTETVRSPVEDALDVLGMADEGAVESTPQAVEMEATPVETQHLSMAVDELEFQLTTWLRDSDDRQLFEQVMNAAQGLELTMAEAGQAALLEIATAVLKLFAALGDGHVPVSRKTSDILAVATDRMRHVIGQIQRNEPPAAVHFIAADIDDLIKLGLAEKGAIDLPDLADQKEEASLTPTQASKEESKPAADEDDSDKRQGARIQHEMVRVRADLLDELVNFAGEVSIYRSRVEQQISTFRGNISEMDQTIARLREQVRHFEINNEAQIESRKEEAQKAGYEDFDPLEFDRFTHMQQLSRSMMESLSDLLSIEEILTGLTRETETLLLQQSRVNTDLQESLIRTRMVPLVENAPRLRRVVRQTAADVGKRASLNFEGVEVEMDRSVVERLMAPLEHMLRNSIAHGIEDRAARLKAGKPEEGHIRVKLSREGSEIVVRVEDDGAGINIEAVRKKAVERGLLSEDVRLADKEVARFILQSGFSTAESLSQVAGRGVGMDVVSSEIKQLGGVLDIDTVAGKGTSFTIRLPLTLAVSRALLVQVAEDIYAIPLLGIRGIERISGPELESLLASENPEFSWLGESYQLMHLTNVLGMGQGVIHSESGKQSLLLASSGEQRIALAVDNLLGSREVVVKSVGPLLSKVNDLAGATILADGNVALIIDMPSLIRRGLAHQDAPQLAEEIRELGEREPIIMVVDDSITVRKVTERLLSRHNMKCVTAKDGVDALTLLEEVIPDVMLLDIEMPRMDGFELATHMRNSEKYKSVPIIMITSRTGDKHRQRAMEIGVNIYMGKPYTEVDLLENIEKLMS
ncbi:MAG: Hpt domain-containing protein [Chromatiales bacterium]|nr:Hpt domain-containing protein [Gammaproteobacteria bacterium]MBW6475643.1 Hpt domain-containing protein [Chromatiales bacterium]